MMRFLVGLAAALTAALLVTVLSIMGIGPMGLVIGFITFCWVIGKMGGPEEIRCGLCEGKCTCGRYLVENVKTKEENND